MRNYIVYRNYIFLILNSLYINQTNAIQMITHLWYILHRFTYKKIKNTKIRNIKTLKRRRKTFFPLHVILHITRRSCV